MPYRNLSTVLAVFLWLAVTAGAHAQTDEVENWFRWERTLTTTRDYHLNGGNPYRNLVLRVTYTPVSCLDSPWCQTFTSYGFWDGGRTFKIRSAFPEGTWNWKVVCSGTANGQDCSTDPALDSVLGGGQTTTTASGTVNVVNLSVPGTSLSDPYRDGLPERGFVRISDDGRFLTYGDTPMNFFWQADTAWGAAIADPTSNTRWNQFLVDRYNRRFTVLLTAIAPDNDSRTITSGGATISIFDDVGSNCTGSTWPKSCSQWNPVYFQNLDEKIRLANEKGMLVVLVGVMDPLGNLNNSSGAIYPDPADAAIFARNLAARLAGSHVIFSPSFDDPLNATTTPLIDWVGCALRDAAPRHLVTAHLAGGSSLSSYQTVHNRRWHQLHVFQSGHAKNTAGINAWEDRYEFASRRARTFPESLYLMSTSGTIPACPNTPAITLPLPSSVKPDVNGEAAYDEVYLSPTYTSFDSQQVDTPQGVRQTGYYSTLNGSFGFTLGVKGLYNWTDVSTTTLDSEGSKHMAILGDQFRAQPWDSLARRSSLVKKQRTEVFNSQTVPEEDKQVVMAAALTYGFALIYAPDNLEVKIDLSSFTNFDCNTTVWTKTWVNPRTGLPPATSDLQPQCLNLTGDADGATHKFVRPNSCTGTFDGESGKCDWLIKLERTKSGLTALSALEAWSQPEEDGEGSRIMGRLRGRDGAPLGEPFAIDERGPVRQHLRHPVVAADAEGSSIVTWEADFDGDLHGIFLRRVDGHGRLLDHEYPVNVTTRHDQFNPWAAAGSAGGVVTWTSYAQDGNLGGIFARLLNRAGVPYGPEIPVNQHRAGHQDFSKVGMDGQGNFVVAWTSDGQEIYVRRFDRWGNPLGGEIEAEATAGGARWLVDLETETNGGFIVTWASYAADGSSLGLWERRFDPQGSPVGGETRVAAP